MSSDDLVNIVLTYEVPEGKVVQFVDTQLTLLHPKDLKLVAELKIDQNRYLVNSEMKLNGKTIAIQNLQSEGWPTLYETKEYEVAKTIYRSYWIQAQMSLPKLGAFSLALPRISVNDVEIPAIQVDFAREVVAYIGYFNC